MIAQLYEDSKNQRWKEDRVIVIMIFVLKIVTNFIWSYLHQFFNDSHGLKASLKLLRKSFDRYQSRLEVINNGWDIKQIN